MRIMQIFQGSTSGECLRGATEKKHALPIQTKKALAYQRPKYPTKKVSNQKKAAGVPAAQV